MSQEDIPAVVDATSSNITGDVINEINEVVASVEAVEKPPVDSVNMDSSSSDISTPPSPVIDDADINPNPWGAVAVTTILAAIILVLWFSMFALNMARG